MSSLCVNDCTKWWEAHECNQQFGEIKSTDIGKSQILSKEGNGRIIKVTAIWSGWAKTVEDVCISRDFERPETDLSIAATSWCINDTYTCFSKQVHWLSRSQSWNQCTMFDGSETLAELNTGVEWARLPIMWIRPRVAHKCKMSESAGTLLNTEWMDRDQVNHGGFKAILILHLVDIKTAYGVCASCHHCLQWHVRSCGWC